jgi:hypothetical protein
VARKATFLASVRSDFLAILTYVAEASGKDDDAGSGLSYAIRMIASGAKIVRWGDRSEPSASREVNA